MQEGYLIDTQLYLSVLTLGEIRRGVEMLQAGERQRTLRIWLEQELPTFFAGRVLPIDGAVANPWDPDGSGL